MTLAAPTFSQIKAHVHAVRQKIPGANVIGIHSPARWTDKTSWEDGDSRFEIAQCDSPLAFRLALRTPVGDSVTKVLITNLRDQELGEDVLLRLAKRRLQQIDIWQIVRSLFDAHAIDPRLAAHQWIAEAIMDAVPRDGFPSAKAGFLDEETVWPLLLEHQINLSSESLDLSTLIQWALSDDNVQRLRTCADEFQNGAIAWLTEKCGNVTAAILRTAMTAGDTDVVAVGLAADVIYHPETSGLLEKASGIFETKYFDGNAPSRDDVLRWAAVATEVVRGLRSTDGRQYEKSVTACDQILTDVDASQHAYLSTVSRAGFDQRLTRFGKELKETVQTKAYDRVSALIDLNTTIAEHDRASEEERRLGRIEMAIRLVQWLEQQQDSQPELRSFEEAADLHLRQDGYVDWARHCLRSGDPQGELSAAYSLLFDNVTEQREKHSAKFAQLLAGWTAAGSKSDDVLPVERILGSFVCPLAAARHVLVVVLDGLSVAVARELLVDVTRHEWREICEPGRSMNRPGIATIPSVTEFSRTSLLSGKFRKGNQEIERQEFQSHPGLLDTCRADSPPVLFHKASLSEAEDSVLSADVRQAIGSTHRRVVGVVVNAVDDHLLKGEQIDTRWEREEIKVLPALLHEARVARRMVVFLSDHGHVLDCNSKGKSYKDDLAGGERWRNGAGTAEDGEIAIEGSRVAVPGQKMIAPWTEKIRYGMKKNGYHGGVSPMEMIAPIIVLSSTDDLPEGWTEKPAYTPAWWDISLTDVEVESEPVPLLKPMVPKAETQPKAKDTLFDLDAETESESEPVTEPMTADSKDVEGDWVNRLLASETFAQQKTIGGRGVPSDELFSCLLRNLDSRGGKMTNPAVARVLEFPAMRLPGLLAKVERVLNIDGYDVLRRDDSSDTVEFNRSLLLTQFDLVESSSND